MYWLLLLTLVTAACWYLALTRSSKPYLRDRRLTPFRLTDQEEQDFHQGVRQVAALTGAIFLTVCLVIALVFTLLRS